MDEPFFPFLCSLWANTPVYILIYSTRKPDPVLSPTRSCSDHLSLPRHVAFEADNSLFLSATTTTPSLSSLKPQVTQRKQLSTSIVLSRIEPSSTPRPASWRLDTRTDRSLGATLDGLRETIGRTPLMSAMTSQVSRVRTCLEEIELISLRLSQVWLNLKEGRIDSWPSSTRTSTATITTIPTSLLITFPTSTLSLDLPLALLNESDRYDLSHPHLLRFLRLTQLQNCHLLQVAVEEGNYGLGPEGLLGNEDCGQMSAWFLFSSFGFYPGEFASSSTFARFSPRSDNLFLPRPSRCCFVGVYHRLSTLPRHHYFLPKPRRTGHKASNRRGGSS